MAIPFLARFGPVVSSAYPIIQRGIRQGVSGNRLISILQEAGFSRRRQVWQEVFRTVKNVQIKSGAIRFTRKDRFFSPNKMGTALGKQFRAFSFVVEARGSLLASGERASRFITVSSSVNLRPADILERAEEIDVLVEGSDPIDAEKLVVIDANVSGDLGTLF